jgi:hypothetical protein
MMKNLLYILYERISFFYLEEKTFRHFKREPCFKELYYAIQLNCISYKTISKLFNLEMVLFLTRYWSESVYLFLITVFIGTKMTGGKTVSRFFLLLFSKLRNILMDIKILHIDSKIPF